MPPSGYVSEAQRWDLADNRNLDAGNYIQIEFKAMEIDAIW